MGERQKAVWKQKGSGKTMNNADKTWSVLLEKEIPGFARAKPGISGLSVPTDAGMESMDHFRRNRKMTGSATPIANSIPPRPINPFGPFTITRPVRVITNRETAKISENQVHQRVGL